MGIRKNQPLRKIDIRTSNVGGGLPLLQEEQTAPPAAKSIPPPDTLILVSQGIQRSTQAPLAFVALSWNEAPNISPDYYNVEWSESSVFTDVQRKRANQLNATIDALKVETTYYFRVQAVQGGTFSAFSSTLSVTTDPDLTVPPDPESVIANFTNSDLVITWEKPVSEVYKDTKVVIYNNLRTILIAGPFYTASERFVFTAEQNIYYTSNNPTKNVSIDVIGRSWSNVESSGVTVTATAALPTTPNTITTTWDNDTGKAPADFTISWLAAPNADSYNLTIDGNTFTTKDTRFTYRYETNLAQHTPTLTSGDYALTWTLQSKDKLTQVSTAASGTAINMPPPSGVLTLSTVIGFSTLGITASLLSNTVIHDFDHYEWTITTASGIITHQSKTKDATIVVPITTSDLYTVKVRITDVFDRSSPYTTASGIMIDTLNIDQLRAEAYYTDNLNNTQSTLAALKDTNTATSVDYPSTGSGIWNWTNIERPLIDRYGVMRYSLLLNNALIYIRTTTDNLTYRYFSGPVVTPAGRSFTIELTEYANETDARTNAFFASDPTLERVQFPTIVEARNIRIFHRIGFGSYRFGLLYPRRLLETDDLLAEEITSLNIRAGSINADRIFAVNLAAIAANIGSAHIDDVLDIGVAGGIYQGTGTFSSPNTGLKIFNVSNIGKLSTYNAGIEQVTLDTDGVLKAGAGNVTLSSGGLNIKASPSLFSTQHALTWTDNVNNIIASAYTNYAGGLNYFNIKANTGGSRTPIIYLQAETAALVLTGAATNYAEAELYAAKTKITGYAPNTTDPDAIEFYTDYDDTIPAVIIKAIGTTLFHKTVYIAGVSSGETIGLEIGEGGSGNRYSYLDLVADDTNTDYAFRIMRNNTGANANTDLYHKGTGALQFVVENAGSMNFWLNGNKRLVFNNTGMGFFGVTPVARQTGGAATADLTYSSNERDMLNALWTAARNYGLLT